MRSKFLDLEKKMPINSKDKGARWERDAVELLNALYPETWRKIPGSGAFGAIMGIPELRGDLVGRYYFMPISFRVDAKTGYGGATQLTVKREWLEKIREEAEALDQYEIPCLVCKFSGSRTPIKHFFVFDMEAYHDIIEVIEDLYSENIRLREKLENYHYGIDDNV